MTVEKIEKPQNRHKICVSIYPSGIAPLNSKKGDVAANINFSTSEVKEKYVENELSFCKTELSEYGGAITKEERFRAREKLETRRVIFAKSQNYGPLTDDRGQVKDKWEWYFKGRDEPTELA
jgi:hypothetical protein